MTPDDDPDDVGQTCFLDPETGLQALPTLLFFFLRLLLVVLSFFISPSIVVKLRIRIGDNIIHNRTVSYCQVKPYLVNNINFQSPTLPNAAVSSNLATAATATWRTRLAARPDAYKLGLAMGEHVEIFAIYRRHRCYRAFPGPTATPDCSCSRHVRGC